MVAQQVEVGEVLVGKVPLVLVLVIQVANVAEELATLEPASHDGKARVANQPSSRWTVLAFDSDESGSVEVGIDGCGEREFGSPQIHAVRLSATVLVTMITMTRVRWLESTRRQARRLRRRVHHGSSCRRGSPISGD